MDSFNFHIYCTIIFTRYYSFICVTDSSPKWQHCPLLPATCSEKVVESEEIRVLYLIHHKNLLSDYRINYTAIL